MSMSKNASLSLCSIYMLLMVAGLMPTPAEAQQVRIRYRPLTPQEITNHGLPANTQKSGGAPNAGIGQPIYMECLVTNSIPSNQISSINWTLIGKPSTSSVATIEAGPIPLNVPSYDGGDRIGYYVASRAMLKPDIASDYDFNNSRLRDYVIKTEITRTNLSVIAVTNVAYGAVYLGQQHYLCQICHADKMPAFEATDHATALSVQISGEGSSHFSPNCISCHTLGYDTDPGATNGGFDDVAAQIGWTFPSTLSPTNWTEMNTNLQNKANVQCESCHGPASAHMLSLGFTNAIDVTLSAGTCGQCHDSLPHHVKAYEWGISMHSTGYVFRFSGSCQPCHSSRGFIETWDPVYAGTSRTPRGTEQEGISCTACHDPHTTGMGEHQLRAIRTATMGNGTVITEEMAGTGVLCMNCHHSRQNNATQIAGSSSLSPHYGAMGDMLAGVNGYEYGLDMPKSRHMQAVENSCVGCHMQLIAKTSFSNLNTKVGGHTFRMAYEDGTNTYKVTEVCSVCHVESGTFDFGGEDYDRDGTVEGVQTEIQDLLDTLGRLLPPVGQTTVNNNSTNIAQRRAIWNHQFVYYDQSKGVHNPKYAAALLQASIQDLSGGIDVDLDGLPDSWEMEKFGNLTSQNGQGDADSDGVSNLLEYQLGLNPNLADTDGDGFSDKVELDLGTDPLNNTSFGETNIVAMMIPAIELGYVPTQAGVTQVFQSVNAMGTDGGWSNEGAPFVSSNGVAYQLISLRDSTQKFYRVVKP